MNSGLSGAIFTAGNVVSFIAGKSLPSGAASATLAIQNNNIVMVIILIDCINTLPDYP